MKKNVRWLFIFSVGALPLVANALDNNLDWSARSRYAEYDGADEARAASLLLRLNLDTHWSEMFSTHVQLDNVSRAFKNEHSDGVDLNGKPLIPDAGGFDVNQAYVAADFDSVKLQLGRQRINLDDQRFVGGNGFWQNEQTFDALLAKIKLLSNSQLTYAYVDNVNRIFGPNADTYLHPGDSAYTGPDSTRPAGLLGEHKHNTHLAQFNYNEWDYSQLVIYGFAMDNQTMPSASNNTLGANYTFTYKADAIKYRIKIESALQRQPEAPTNPLLPFYSLDAGIGISHVEFTGRYEVVSNKDGINFITPLSSSHDFQGLANQSQNYARDGLKDASLGISWRASPFKIETQYHQFNAYTVNDYLAQELDVSFSYKPNRKHAITFLATFFKPEFGIPQKGSTQKFFMDYSYNF